MTHTPHLQHAKNSTNRDPDRPSRMLYGRVPHTFTLLLLARYDPRERTHFEIVRATYLARPEIYILNLPIIKIAITRMHKIPKPQDARPSSELQKQRQLSIDYKLIARLVGNI